MKTFKQFLREDQGNVETSDDYHKRFHENLKAHFPNEYDIILNAAKRNNIADTDYDNLSMLYAIRKGEAGRRGRQFGVLSPAAMEQPGDTDEMTLDRQAGWAASSLLKNRERYEKSDKSDDFVTFMGRRWAPPNVKNDPTNLNQHWAKNVSKFKETYMTCTGPNCKPNQTQTTPQPTQAPVQTEQPKAQEQSSSSSEYVVKQGDTLSQIAKNNNTTVDEIAKTNKITDVNKIRPNQRLILPTKTQNGTKS
jgi:LysM repeat protein